MVCGFKSPQSKQAIETDQYVEGRYFFFWGWKQSSHFMCSGIALVKGKVLYIVMPWELRAEPEVQGVNAPIAVSSLAWQPRRSSALSLKWAEVHSCQCQGSDPSKPQLQGGYTKSACAILEWEIVLGQVHPDYTAISAKVVTEVGYVLCAVYIVFFSGIWGWEWCVFGDLIMSKSFKLTMYTSINQRFVHSVPLRLLAHHFLIK